METADTLAYFGELRFGLSGDRSALAGRGHAEREQFAYFPERESERLRITNEAEALDRVLGVIPIAGKAPLRPRDKAAALVKAQSIHAHAGPRCDTTNRHLNSRIDP